MLKDYGMLAGNSRRKSPFLRDTDDHAIRLKRVPLTQAQNHKTGYNVEKIMTIMSRVPRVALTLRGWFEKK